MKLILAWATATFVVLMWGAAAASSTAVASTGFGPQWSQRLPRRSGRKELRKGHGDMR